VNGWLWEARGCLKRKKKDRPFEKTSSPRKWQSELVGCYLGSFSGRRHPRHGTGSTLPWCGIAGMVQARQAEAAFERFQQREVRVEVAVLHALQAGVGVHDEQNPVGGRRYAVVVFVPEHHDSVAPVVPSGRLVNRLDDIPQNQIANVHERRVEPDQRSVVIGIKVTLCASVSAAVLIIALIRCNKGKIRHAAGAEIFEQPVVTLKPSHSLQAEFRVPAFLHAAKIYKWVMLRGV
jgi:hypothetical protein